MHDRNILSWKILIWINQEQLMEYLESNVYCDFWSKHRIGEDGGPSTLRTSFGYVAMGRIPVERDSVESLFFPSTKKAPPMEEEPL